MAPWVSGASMFEAPAGGRSLEHGGSGTFGSENGSFPWAGDPHGKHGPAGCCGRVATPCRAAIVAWPTLDFDTKHGLAARSGDSYSLPNGVFCKY